MERGVRAALAAYGTALLAGPVAAQYVGAGLFGYLTPIVVGVLVAVAAQAAAAGMPKGPAARLIRLIACVYAVLAVALGFVLEQSQSPLSVDALLPYAGAMAGAVLWTLPPKARAQAG